MSDSLKEQYSSTPLYGSNANAVEALYEKFLSDPASVPAAWAEQVLECAPLSVRASKEQVQRGLEEASLEAALAGRYPGTARLFKSEDFVEGPRAFAEKRPPRWKGR